MKRFCILAFVFLILGRIGGAESRSPIDGRFTEPPLEALLNRAHDVFLVRLIEVSSTGQMGNFSVEESLRGTGQTPLKLMVRQPLIPAQRTMQANSEWLLLSQCDAKHPFVPFFRTGFSDQEHWWGWIRLPVERIGNKIYAMRSYSFTDGQPYDDRWSYGKKIDLSEFGLSLERIKGLLKRFPYNPPPSDTN